MVESYFGSQYRKDLLKNFEMAVRIGRALFLGFFAVLLQRYYTLLGFYHDEMIDKHFEVSLEFIRSVKNTKILGYGVS